MQIRHREVSRLEGFSDAVFGFALTLLVVSLETPRDMSELRGLLRGLLPFAVTFAMVCWIWYEHNVFFRRYGLQNPWIVFLNCVLLFVVLFYVYPLRFLAASLLGDRMLFSSADAPFIMYMYSSGVLLIFSVFVLMHWHAWRRRAALGLTEAEVLALRYGIRAHSLSASIAMVSLLLIYFGAPAGLAGMIYILMGPLHGINGYQGGRAQEKLKAISSHEGMKEMKDA
jgi:uncharacterized membrane protein